MFENVVCVRAGKLAEEIMFIMVKFLKKSGGKQLLGKYLRFGGIFLLIKVTILKLSLYSMKFDLSSMDSLEMLHRSTQDF
jgi:hypothetical protein